MRWAGEMPISPLQVAAGVDEALELGHRASLFVDAAQVGLG